MRLAVALSLAAVAAPGPAKAGPAAPAAPKGNACVWRDDPTAPGLLPIGRILRYERAFECPGAAAGEYSVTFAVESGGQRREVGQEKGKIVPRGRWARTTHVEEPLAPSGLCALPLPTGAAVRLAPGHDTPRRLPSVAVEVTATFRGTGDLAALDRTERAEAVCDACPAERHWTMGIGLYEGRAMTPTVRAGTRLQAHAERAWFDCAKQGAKLEVRYFTADDDAALRKALRPAYVQSGLEKQFRVAGDEQTLSVPVPIDKLCRHPGRRLAWEVWGEGLLPALGGGGRSYHDLKCR